MSMDTQLRELLCKQVYDKRERLSLYFPISFHREKTSESYADLSYTGHIALALALIACMYI